MGCGISSAPTPLQPHHCFPGLERLQGLQQQPRTCWELTKTVGPGTSQVHGRSTRDSHWDWGCWHCTPAGSATRTRNTPAKSGPRHQTFSNEGRGSYPAVLTEAAIGFTARRWHLCLTCTLLCVVTAALFPTPPLHRDTVQSRLVGRDHVSGRNDHPSVSCRQNKHPSERGSSGAAPVAFAGAEVTRMES